MGAGEVETALLSHPSVLEAAVVGAPDDDLGQRIVAYVVGSDIDAAEQMVPPVEEYHYELFGPHMLDSVPGPPLRT